MNLNIFEFENIFLRDLLFPTSYRTPLADAPTSLTTLSKLDPSSPTYAVHYSSKGGSTDRPLVNYPSKCGSTDRLLVNY